MSARVNYGSSNGKILDSGFSNGRFDKLSGNI